MRMNLFTAGLCIAAACHLQAETTVEGPRLGYVATKTGLRSVVGIVGASRLGDPVARDLAPFVALPGSDIAVGVKPTGELTRVGLKDGSESDLGLAGVSSVVASPSGEVVVAISGEQAYWFAKSGDRLADHALPGAPRLIAVADRGSAAAITVAEAEGEAVYLISDQGARRVLHAARIPAIAFLPNSGDFVFADDTGAIYRLGIDLSLTQLTALSGVKALAGTADGTRLLLVTEHAVVSLRFATQDTTSAECSCTAAIARPLGGSTFLITDRDDAPMWVVDASGEELRLAFIPEAVVPEAVND
jgi:hypothetical protein